MILLKTDYKELMGVILIVGENSIRCRDGMFERTEILLKKYREFLVRAKEIRKKVCVNEILPRLGENEEWCSRGIGINEAVHMLYESMNCTYLDIW